MARRNVSVHDRERWVFNRLAVPYRARPGYPGALLERLLGLAAGRGRRVADLGAGTGLLALPLAWAGMEVHAVEPAAAMLEALSANARDLPIVPVHAPAEETGLPSGAFDLVLLADSLQWVDPERCALEVSRLLAPGGVLAVIDPRPAPTPFMDALGDRIAAANARARPRPPPVALLFSLTVRAAPAEERFQDARPLDDARLEAVLRSLSYVGPALGPDAADALVADARTLAARHGGAVWARDITLWWAERA